MSFRDAVKRIIQNYFIIVTGVLFCEALFYAIFITDLDLSVTELWHVLIAGVFYSLPELVFCSQKELSKKQWRRRTVLHVLLLEVVVIGSAHVPFQWLVGFNVREHVFMALTVPAVYAVVTLTGWMRDQLYADQINQKLTMMQAEDEGADRAAGSNR